MTTFATRDSLAELRADIRGSVLTSESPEYNQARAVWNAMVDKKPAVIVRCAGAADVMQALKFARASGLEIAVRGGGHSIPGFSTCDGGMLIDLSPMRSVRVDPEARTATAEGGALWQDVDRESQAFGLATTGGLVSHTGIAGLTLGGGIGWLMRKHGLACDNLRSADVVTAEGQLLRASSSQNEDLFWGLRGGGGNFGIVTVFEYQLHPVGPIVLGGLLLYPLSATRDLLRFYRQWTPGLPEELTTLLVFLTAPAEPFIPESMRGRKAVAFILCHAGEVEEGMRALAPLKQAVPPTADVVRPLPYVALQRMFDGGAPWGLLNYTKTECIDDLSDDLAGVLEEWAEKAPTSMLAIHLHHLEGAVARSQGGPTAAGRRDSRYLLNIVGRWQDPNQSAEQISWVRGAWSAIQPFAAGSGFVNFMDGDEQSRVRAAYGENYDRLVATKRKYDPGNVFRLNQNIRP